MTTDLDYKKKLDRLVNRFSRLVDVPKEAKLEDEDTANSQEEIETEQPNQTDELPR